jgi:hypothetical protein
MKKFGYENLDVWNRAVDFAVKVIELVMTLLEIFRRKRWVSNSSFKEQQPDLGWLTAYGIPTATEPHLICGLK